jgi:hypothetical protein
MPARSAKQAPATPPSWPVPNPALSDLSLLVGEWEMELSNSAFLPGPSDTVKGSASFAWTEDGAFLAMRQGTNSPSALWLIGRDEASTAYEIFYYDSRGVSRIYAMSLRGGTWKIWRNSPGFSQRYEAAISANGSSIKAAWEKSSDGQAWEHDFDITYTRLR